MSVEYGAASAAGAEYHRPAISAGATPAPTTIAEERIATVSAHSAATTCRIAAVAVATDGSVAVERATFDCEGTVLDVNRASRTKSTSSLSASITTFRGETDRKSTRLNSSHVEISYAVFCLKKKKI